MPGMASLDRRISIIGLGELCFPLPCVAVLMRPSNPRDDAPKLKWDGIRCLLDEAQSDMLLLFDSCAVRDAPIAGGLGVKQVIAAYSPDQSSLDPGPRSFTAVLVDALNKLHTGHPFTTQRLYQEVAALKHQDAAPHPKLNGANGATPATRIPHFFTLAAAANQTIKLTPLDPSQPAETKVSPSGRDDAPIGPADVNHLIFQEPRVLACTTFVGDASPDMTSFNQWLHSSSPIASLIAVEGMFLGPPTMLMISMPHSIWNIVQHDKVCCFLGHIKSNNLIHLYQRIVNAAPKEPPAPALAPAPVLVPAPMPVPSAVPAPAPLPASSAMAPANNLREARDPIGKSPAYSRRRPLQHETPARQAPAVASSSSAVLAKTSPSQPATENHHVEVEESAEMKEAAEQLKALSHVRHNGEETPSTLERSSTRIGDSIAVRHPGDPGSSPEAGESGADEKYTPSAKPRGRKPLQKQPPKQETRCTHCSHAPFKDSSSLRKHIAAAHTRPFPCAFSFAGCTSTFGSKNEWKRHIASQHLCLNYYRCSSCTSNTPDGKGNEFNRKDLFTQHLRRMHAPFAIKKSLVKGDSKQHAEWEAHLKEMQQSCLVIRRSPPQRSACPKPDCRSVFEGYGSWDEWTEHVGRHMEKNEAAQLGVDDHLVKWALKENIIEPQDDGEYKLCAEKTEGQANGSSFISDLGKREDEDPSITVAMPIMNDAMDMD